MGLKDSQIARSFNGRLIFTVSVLMLSQINFGMDLTAFNTTQAMDAFEEKFGVYNPKTKGYVIEPYFLSLLNSLTYVGQVVGVLLGGWIARTWGRVMAFYVMCFWAIIAAILLVTAQHKEQMLVGRIVNYIYIGQELVTVPVMQSEIVPPNVRGFVVATYQLGLMIGGFIMALICYGTSHMDGKASYQIPLGLFFVVPVLVLCSLWYMPESPRWLLVRDRHEEALVNLRKYRQGRFTEEEIMEEFHTQLAYVKLTREKGSLKEMWQGTNLKRSLIVIFANICVQISGQSFASKYSSFFIKDVGVLNPFKMTLISTGISIAVVLLSMNILDIVGRRNVLIIGSTVQTVSMLTMGGLGTIPNLTNAHKIAISWLLTVFYLGFCFGWATTYHVLTGEIPNSRMRDITFTVASCCTVVTQFVVSFTIPYLYSAPYANLGPKLGLIFGSAALCTLIFAILFIPECQKLSLEEVDHLFMQRTPILKFRHYKHGDILPPEVLVASKEKMEVGPSVEEREVAG